MQFELGGEQTYRVAEIVFSSPRTELDCTILTLDAPIEMVNPYAIARQLPLVGKNQDVYLIGHPRGGALSFSISDTMLLDFELPLVHYSSITSAGNSGSPVFNQQWSLIAMHHASGAHMKRLNGKEGSYSCNEGISIHSIRCLLYTSPSPRDATLSRMPSSA